VEVSRAAVATWALLVVLAPAARAAPLTARAKPAPADGATIIPVVVRGGPDRDDAENEDHPALPAVSCAQAATLPPGVGGVPMIIAPFRPGGGTLECTVRLRGEETKLTVALLRPPPGVYASVEPPVGRAGDRLVHLRTVVVEPDGRVREGKRLRAAASTAVAARVAGGEAWLALPPSAAPRAVAVVLDVDGRPAAAFLPVMGRVQIPVRTRHARTVKVRLPGGYAGPLAVQGERVSVPVEVPPGVALAVVRALSGRGEAKEEVVDLNPPRLPRIAALGPDGPLTVGVTRSILVAVADGRGAPAPAASAPAARPDRGAAEPAAKRGPGLWEIVYRAPATPGPDRITITAPADAAAGAVELQLAVLAGAPNVLRVTLPRHALLPGTRLVGALAVRDAAGNPLTGLPLRAWLGSAPARIEPTEAGFDVVATVPERLDGRVLRLRVEAPGARLDTEVAVQPGPAAAARLSLRPAGRRADVAVSVVDRHGNAVEPEDFQVRASGGRLGSLRAEGTGFRADLEADPWGRGAEVEVSAAGEVLARERVRFAPPPGLLRLGAWAGVAWLHNLGDLSAPRFGGGAALRRAFGPVELTFATGIEGVVWSDTKLATIAGAERSLDRRLTVLAVPVSLRARVPLRRGIGMAVGIGAIPTWGHGRVEADFQAPETFSKWTVGVRGEASGDVALGPGRVVLSLGYGRAALDGTPISGNLDGLFVRLGYEWWFTTLER
jgi:hypothetical protein